MVLAGTQCKQSNLMCAILQFLPDSSPELGHAAASALSHRRAVQTDLNLLCGCLT